MSDRHRPSPYRLAETIFQQMDGDQFPNIKEDAEGSKQATLRLFKKYDRTKPEAREVLVDCVHTSKYLRELYLLLYGKKSLKRFGSY